METQKEDSLSPLYIAGFFDGEGCIAIQKQWVKGKYEKYPRIRLDINVTNTHDGVLIKLLQKYGGRFSANHKGGTHQNKPCHRWRLTGKQPMLQFLNDILPYSVVKKKDIEAAILFCETIREENLGCTPLTKEDHAIRMGVYNDIKSRRIRRK